MKGLRFITGGRGKAQDSFVYLAALAAKRMTWTVQSLR